MFLKKNIDLLIGLVGLIIYLSSSLFKLFDIEIFFISFIILQITSIVINYIFNKEFNLFTLALTLLFIIYFCKEFIIKS